MHACICHLHKLHIYVHTHHTYTHRFSQRFEIIGQNRIYTHTNYTHIHTYAQTTHTHIHTNHTHTCRFYQWFEIIGQNRVFRLCQTSATCFQTETAMFGRLPHILMKVDGLEYAWSAVPKGSSVRRSTPINATQSQNSDDMHGGVQEDWYVDASADEYADMSVDAADEYVSVSTHGSTSSRIGSGGGADNVIGTGKNNGDTNLSVRRSRVVRSATSKSLHTSAVPVQGEDDVHTHTESVVSGGVYSTAVHATGEDAHIHTVTVPAVAEGSMITTTSSIYDVTHDRRADTNFFTVEGPRISQATIQRRPPARIGTPFVFTVQGSGLMGNSVQMHMKLVRKDAFGGTSCIHACTHIYTHIYTSCIHAHIYTCTHIYTYAFRKYHAGA
jgi:hypothetical protein